MAHQRPSRGNHGSSEAIKRQSWLIRGHQKAIMAHQRPSRGNHGSSEAINRQSWLISAYHGRTREKSVSRCCVGSRLRSSNKSDTCDQFCRSTKREGQWCAQSQSMAVRCEVGNGVISRNPRQSEPGQWESILGSPSQVSGNPWQPKAVRARSVGIHGHN